MSIENLIAVIPPPAQPYDPFGGPWKRIEAELGTALPQDYKELVLLYGEGAFLEVIGIHTPMCWSQYARLAPAARTICEDLGADKDLPYSLWPNSGGLLPFGGTDFGDYLFWLTQGPPDDWRVVAWDRGQQRFEAFDCDLTDFLAGLSTGDILPRDLPDDLAECEEGFRPYRPRPGMFSPIGGASLRLKGEATLSSFQWSLSLPSAEGD